jgi:hypothetical protein
MPWTPSSGPKRHTKKANTPKKRRQWSHVANAILAKSGNEGQAIREANAVVARHNKAKKLYKDTR